METTQIGLAGRTAVQHVAQALDQGIGLAQTHHLRLEEKIAVTLGTLIRSSLVK